MKNLVKTLFVALLIFLTLQSKAQLTFGIKAGLNANNIIENYKESDYESDNKMRIGYHIGAAVDYALSDEISIQSGLLWSSKGCSYDLEEDLEENQSVDGYSRMILNYLEIPIHAAYKINGFQIYAGPYVAFGLGGKTKWDYTYSYNGMEISDDGDAKLKAFLGEVGADDLKDDEGAYNGLDFGFDLGLGYQAGPILINAGYSLGLGNLTPKYEGGDDDYRKDNKDSNRVITLSVSYFFGE